MRIVCLGNAADDILDRADSRYRLTKSTSQKMEDYFNVQGGNTPLKGTGIVKKNEPSFFDKAFGIFSSLTGPASVAPEKAPYVVGSSPVPYLGFAAVALGALLIYKVSK
jgi:hypothetical protein